jgi:hypothetical protein
MKNFQTADYSPEFRDSSVFKENSGQKEQENKYEAMIPAPELYDYNGDFTYEDFERMTGMSYLNYLRSQDDML